MNSKLQIPILRPRAGRALAAAFALAFASGACAQTTYTWTGATLNWTNTAAWEGATVPSTNGTGVVLYAPAGTSSVTSTLPASGVDIAALDTGTATLAWSIVGSSTATAATFAIINQTDSGGLTIRDNAADGTALTLTVSTVNVSSGTLSLGGAGGSATPGYELGAISGTPNVNMGGTGTTTLDLNVLGSGGTANYTLGVIDAAASTTSVINLIANSDTLAGSTNANVTVTGLEGTGALTVNGAEGAEGGMATLTLVGSGGTTYTSAAALTDKTGSPKSSQLALTVNMASGGTQVLTGNSTYTGVTTITSGSTLQIGNNGISGTLGSTGGVGGNVVNDGTLAFSRSGTPSNSIGNVITGTGVVKVIGSGNIAFTGNNTYSGGTLVNLGALYVNNTAGSGLGTGAVTVASGATLGGGGTIALSSNAVTVNGTLTGATSATATSGTLTLGSGTTLAFGSGSAMAVTLGTSSTSVVFSGTAANSVTGLGNVTLNITEGAGFSAAQTYTILGNATTATAGSSYTVDAVDLNGTPLTAGTYTLVVDSSNDYTFEDSAVPEPADYALLLGAVVLGCALVRRRRKPAHALDGI